VGDDTEDESGQAAAADHPGGALEVALVLRLPLAQQPLLGVEQVLDDAASVIHRALAASGADALHRDRWSSLLVELERLGERGEALLDVVLERIEASLLI